MLQYYDKMYTYGMQRHLSQPIKVIKKEGLVDDEWTNLLWEASSNHNGDDLYTKLNAPT